MTHLSTVSGKAALIGVAAILCLNVLCFPLPLYAAEGTASGTTEMMLSQAEDAATKGGSASTSPTALAKTSDDSLCIPVFAAFAGVTGIVFSIHKPCHRKSGDQQ